MPNMQGGKKYKSSKNSTESKAVLYTIEEGQQIGRIVKVLGNKRMVVYCNDEVQRICKIRGSLGKKVWIAKGDIVLISIREDLAAGTTGTTHKVDVSDERGDILEKYDTSIIGKLKKEEGVNPKVFMTIEAMDAKEGQEDYFDCDEEENDYETKPKSKDHRINLVESPVTDVDIDIDRI
jgi:translation initiation factor 1A